MMDDVFLEVAFLERLRARDTDAVGAVFDAYVEHIFRAARGAGLDPAAAEDLTQNVFTTFIETLPRFEGRSTVRTWLFGILYRKIKESRRNAARQDVDDIDVVFESRFDASGSWVRPPATPEDSLDRAETRAALADCLEGVPDRQAAAFRLREVEGFSTGEICKILEATVTNVGVMLHRARNRLRECLEKKGFGLDAGS